MVLAIDIFSPERVASLPSEKKATADNDNLEPVAEFRVIDQGVLSIMVMGDCKAGPRVHLSVEFTSS